MGCCAMWFNVCARVQNHHVASLVALIAASMAVDARAACVGISSAAIDARFVEARSACGNAGAKVGAPRAIETPAFADMPRSVAIQYPGSTRAKVARARVAAARLGPNAHYAAVESVARRYGIDPALLQSIVRQESGYRLTARSKKGALGLMQLMPATARGLGVSDVGQLTRDPVLNLSAGAAYLKQLQGQLGNNVPHVLAAYNAGPGAVRRYRGVPPYRETRSYVGSILSNYGRLRGQAIR